MASKQYFIYNTDDGGYVDKARSFTLTKGQQKLIRAAGLTETVEIYQMVGVCNECRPEDVLWEPVTSCGSAVSISADDNRLWLFEPGTYSIGDPNTQTVLAGDVNITGENFTGVDVSTLGKCSDDSPLIGDSCDNPIFTEICNQVPVETAMASLGCISDASGQQIGKVMLCKITDELTGTSVVTQTAYYEDGTVTENYSGPWQVCQPDVCLGEPFIGVITDLSILTP